ncbi:hypothetical protein IHV09_22090 [Fictibacillus sp. 23RED33]|uniref:hypothetical protein n=1 Tax=Fictibacillus sp. 23RED33 TaxID=2745879 RepID=UPI0018CED2E8|nr:hypothetical protein [Fictibacillus sp. 23RED33]MBH0176251.1 hypothetical protein [Fictibacillus sp. 23RED33]
MIKNPIARIKEEKGYSWPEFAEVLGISRARILQLNGGVNNRISESILKRLNELGYDSKEINREYVLWKIKMLDRLKKELLRSIS